MQYFSAIIIIMSYCVQDIDFSAPRILLKLAYLLHYQVSECTTSDTTQINRQLELILAKDVPQNLLFSKCWNIPCRQTSATWFKLHGKQITSF